MSNTFTGKILKEFIKKYSFRSYLDRLKKIPLWHITRIDQDLTMNKLDE